MWLGKWNMLSLVCNMLLLFLVCVWLAGQGGVVSHLRSAIIAVRMHLWHTPLSPIGVQAAECYIRHEILEHLFYLLYLILTLLLSCVVTLSAPTRPRNPAYWGPWTPFCFSFSFPSFAKDSTTYYSRHVAFELQQYYYNCHELLLS